MRRNVTICSCFKVFISIILFNYITCDCPFPKNGLPNGRFIYESPEDADGDMAKDLYILRFKCSAGFQRKGSRSILCNGNTWSASLPRCEVNQGMRCLQPPSIENSENTLRSGENDSATVGSLLTYSCKPGYELDDSSAFTLLCVLEPGARQAIWKGKMPACKEIKCSDPPTIRNAESILQSGNLNFPTIGSSVTYSCEFGYQLENSGAFILHCVMHPKESHAIWKGKRPVCKVIKCPDPPYVKNAEYSLQSGDDFPTVSSTLTYSCKFGYILEDTTASLIQCVMNPAGTHATWMGKMPVCKEVKCPRPPKVENAEYMLQSGDDKFPTIDSTVTYSCEFGYQLEDRNASILECGMESSGHGLEKFEPAWKGKVPVCKVMNCRDPGSPEHGSRIGDTFNVGAKVRYKCVSGYYLSGSSERYCNPDGQWTGELASCLTSGSFQCGIGKQNVGNDQGKVVGGRISVEPWPWMAALYLSYGQSNPRHTDLFCGGSIINHDFILTAAHCLYEKRKLRRNNDIVVKLGLTDATNETYVQRSDVKEIFVHPEYKPGLFDYDIALLHLYQPVEYNQFVKPICLPPVDLLRNSTLYGSDEFAWAIGWGHDSKLAINSREPIKTTQILKEVLLPLQPRELCFLNLLENRHNPSFFTDRMFCAGDGKGGNDTCSGDSGGPLLQSQLNKEGYVFWTQIGITSWGFGCANEDTYGYYTHVQRLRSWVDNTIAGAL